MTKSELRRQMLERRSTISEGDRSLWDQLIFERAHKHRAFQIASRVHVYRSTEEEVETTPFIEYAWGIGKEVFVPITPQHGSELLHCRVSWTTRWKVGGFGIMEPIPQSADDLVSASSFDDHAAIIVPVVAFDKACHRLGYGKGYYDRFLSETRAARIGIAYQCQYAPTLPLESHDIALSAVATQECWYRP